MRDRSRSADASPCRTAASITSRSIEFAKYCLLNGVDELDYTLSQVDQIAAFESRYARATDG